MNSWFRTERLQLIVTILSLVAMVIVPELRNFFGLRSVPVSESIVETRGSPPADDKRPPNAPPTSNLLAVAYKKLDARQGTETKTESGRVRPALTLKGLTRQLRLQSAILSFESTHSREPNGAELDTLIDGVLSQTGS